MQKKSSKKEAKKIQEKRAELARQKKYNDDDDHDGDDWDDDSSYSEDDEDQEMSHHEYQKLLASLFPSKFLDKKIKKGDKLIEKIKSHMDDDSEEEEDYEEEEYNRKVIKNNGKSKKTLKKPQTQTKSKGKKYSIDDSEEEEEEPMKKKKSKGKVVEKTKAKSSPKKSKNKKYDSETESDEDSDDYSDCVSGSDSEYETLSENDSDKEDEEEDDVSVKKGKKSKKDNINIIFTIGADNEDYDDDDSYWEDDEDEDDDKTEDENETIVTTSDDSSDEDSDEDEKEDYKRKYNKKKNVSNKKFSKIESKKSEKSVLDQIKQAISKKDPSSDENVVLVINENNGESSSSAEENKEKVSTIQSDDVFLNTLKDIYGKNKDSEVIKKCIKICEDEIKEKNKHREKKEKKYKERNSRIFKKIIADKNTMNDYKFFENYDIDKQKKILKEVREINKISRVEKPYRLTLLEADIPTAFKATAMKKISSLRYMEPGTGEYYKIKNWVDTFMRIPFGKYETLPTTIDDGVEKCHDFMEHAQKTLDDAVYGLNDAKMQIMQLVGQLITNPGAIGTAIAIHGAPGTGKTSLIKEGVSKILNRPFAFIALGGATDSSFLEGHSYTYEGSTWGKIVQILIDSKCMNPVIYFDELDKISDTPKGEEIAGILTHLTDTSQNMQFHDKYFSEVDFDLSKCLFIFSYNDESKVNPILKDRMYRIQTKGYDKKEKTNISSQYLLPRIREQTKFEKENILIPDETLHYIIEHHCNKEEGVRNLKRALEIIYTKLNLYRLMKPDTNLFEQEMSLKVSFPFQVTKEIVDKLIKKEKENDVLRNMYI